jgi:hypothetical protein
MTELQKELSKGIQKSIDYFIHYFKKSKSYISIDFHHRDYALELFYDILTEALTIHYNKYTLPDKKIIDDKFDLMKSFNHTFRDNCLKNVFYEYKRRMDNQYEHNKNEIPFSGYSNNSNKMKYEEENNRMNLTEDDDLLKTEIISKGILMNKIDAATRVFLKYCNTHQSKMVEGMWQNKTYNKVIKEIGITKNGSELSYDEARYIRKLLEYRLILHYYCSLEIFSEKSTLNALNKFPKLNKRFFGEEELNTLPALEEMMKVVKREV